MCRLRRLTWMLLLIVLPAAVALAQPLRLRLQPNTDWVVTLGPGDLTGAAGTDFPTDIQSDPGAQQIRLQNTNGNWRIDVSRGGGSWNSGIRVYVRRTTDGTGGTVVGGTAYHEITTTDTTFLTGTGNIRDVGLQFMTNGAFAGAGVPSGAYSTTVTYTVTDNL